MGIQNLLPNIASIAIDRHLSDYAGLTVAVDGYSWLHKASTCCARDLCLNASAGIDKLVRSVLKKIELLRRHRVEPYMVFDGAPLPAKAGTEIKRAADRARHLQRANELAAHGDATQANLYYQKAVDISPHMAHALCQRLRELNVRFVVAPFEADAQLAYMIHEKLVDAIFTEDSDLLAYNSARVFFKLDADGSGKEVSIQNLTQCSELNFFHWTFDMFTQFCILCGCDYLPSIKGVGPKKAHALMHENRTIENIMRRLRLDGALCIPPSYLSEFYQAFHTFRHQRVFDPRSQRVVHLNPLTDSVAQACPDLAFLGPDIPAELSALIAAAELDPCTLQPFAALPAQSVELGSHIQTPRSVSIPQRGPNLLTSWLSRTPAPTHTSKCADECTTETAASDDSPPPAVKIEQFTIGKARLDSVPTPMVRSAYFPVTEPSISVKPSSDSSITPSTIPSPPKQSPIRRAPLSDVQISTTAVIEPRVLVTLEGFRSHKRPKVDLPSAVFHAKPVIAMFDVDSVENASAMTNKTFAAPDLDSFRFKRAK